MPPSFLRLEVAVIFRALCPPIDWEEAIYQHLLRQRARVRSAVAEIRAERKKLGLCTHCGVPAGGRAKCEIHLRYYAQQKQASKAQRRALG